ncbi:type II toxin-antitoxin system ParD family antitoxin [Endozoicomonas sp. Mp262]|uniref:type II toxin-antitoxin system ParD family antitoxin n=1 Tax=Endozoicomonas sp. Mp262 TaxID=2919499 RepID=UPI0021D96F56
MARQSISLTEPNEEWLKEQVDSKEYTSKSEVVNDLIRQARRRSEAVKQLQAELIAGENSGICDLTPDEIKEQVLTRRRSSGKL